MNYRIMKIASKIASDVMKEIESKEVEAFDMTEREWEVYKIKHPLADPANHHIIQVPGKSYKESNYREYMKRERRAKKKYFKKMRKLHPNYIPMIKKDQFMDIIMNGEYSCISADVNPNDQEDIERCQDPEYVKKRRELLRSELDKLGVKYTEIAGSYGKEEQSFLISHTIDAKISQKHKDNSFLVTGNVYSNTEGIIEKLNNLGKLCNQDSVTHSRGGIMEWHYTTGEKGKNRKRIVTGNGTIAIPADSGDKHFSEGRVSDQAYTKWKANTENALDENFDLKTKNLIDNPYFKG